MTATTKKTQSQETIIAIMGEQISRTRQDIADIKDSIKELSNKIDHSYATKPELISLQNEVNGLKDNVKWVVRLIMGAVIAGIMGLILVR